MRGKITPPQPQPQLQSQPHQAVTSEKKESWKLEICKMNQMIIKY